MKDENQKTEIKQLPNPIGLSARFLAARPDLVGAWIIGAHSLVPIFKSQYKEAIITFLETVEHEFFAALHHHWNKKHPNQRLDYTFGTIIKNKHNNKERMVIAIEPGYKIPGSYIEAVYHYIDDVGKVGACNGSTMNNWQWK